MRTLIGAGTIRTIREVWWDIRPHPGFGTLELRICDGIPTMDELCAVVALSQSLVVWLGERYDNGLELPAHRAWTIRDNKWRASRYGLEAEIIRDEEGNVMALKRSIRDLVEKLEPTAEKLGCREDLRYIDHILERGTSASRQREVFAEAHDMSAVVDSLVEEMCTGSPRGLSHDDPPDSLIDRGDHLFGEPAT
jgi:carboxylate-amine ligase